MGGFFAELKRRQMFRVAAAYTVVAWLLLQIVNNVAPVLDLPVWVARAILLLLVIGFPIALLFVWMRDLSPADGAAPKAATTKLDYALIGALVLVIALVSYQQLAPSPRDASIDRPSQLGAIAVAVLPFENLSGDATQEFFSDGVTEEISAVLTRVPNLQVVARTSAFAIDRQNRSVGELGRALGATHLIDGSVRRAGNRVRITAQLVRVDNGLNLWSENFDRDLTDIFAIQEDIAQAIAGALRVPLGLAQGDTLVHGRTGDVASYEDYLRARALRREGGASVAQAIEILERVVARDPGFASAWALLARSYEAAPLNSPLGRIGPVEERARLVQSSFEKSERAAREAIRLDPTNAVGYAALADAQSGRGQWAGAEDLYRRALALDGNEPEVLQSYNGWSRSVGRLKEALRVAERLRTLDPLAPAFPLTLAQSLQVNGQNQRSIAILEMLPPNLGGGFGRNVALARAYAEEGRFSDAADTLLAMQTNLVSRQSIENAARIIRSAPAKVGAPLSLPLLESANLSFVYAHVGAAERLMDMIERGRDDALDVGALIPTLWLRTHADLRDTGRFKTFVRSVGLVDYWRARGWPDLCRPVGVDDFECD